MPHPRIQAHRAAYQRQAAGIRAQLAQAERAQLADPDLSPAQRRRNIGHLRRQTEGRLATLRRQYDDGKPAILRAIWAPLFKLPPSVNADMSWRDAMTRAAALDSQDEALRMMDTALMVGDELMVKALAFHACPDPIEHPPRWPAVAARWQQSSSYVRESVREFDECWQELNDKAQQYQDSTMFTLPTPQQAPDRDALPSLGQLPDLSPAVGGGGGEPASA